jgi:hypothetical protein
MPIPRRFLLLLFMLLCLGVNAATPTSDPWSPVRFLLGEWVGTSTGQPGEGSVIRRYEWVLNQQFIRENNTSTYPAQEKNQRGEVHEHVGFLSYDKGRKLIVLRQFHIESFVNQYVLDPAASSATRVVFVSERFENLSNEWRAREIYDIVSADEFFETFELAEPGKPFQVYSKNHFRRDSK